MYQYILVEEHATDPDIGQFITYGIELRRNGELLEAEHDVDTDRRLVACIAALCAAEQVEPVHLRDVIRNFI